MSTKRPNILIIMSDQHHAGVMGCAGDPVVQTPNLDRLAASGVRFDSAYCASPLCCPSRMSFMTARHPHEIGVWENEDELRSDIPTFAHVFHAAGYDTILAGRMHFVGADQRHGFAKRLIGDVVPTAYLQGGWQLDRVVGNLQDTCGTSLNGIVKSGPGHTGYKAYDEAVTETTVDWLRKRPQCGDAPFMLTVGYVSPHCPFVAPPDDFEYYRHKIAVADLPGPDEALHPRNAALRKGWGIDPAPPVDAQWRTRVAYYGLTTFIDRQIGAVLDALDASGLADNTIVVYCSDHGESLGEHGMWWKSTFYEGSSRVPLIVSSPKRLKAGVRGENVNLMDVGPTVLALSGLKPLPGASGRSFAPLLEDRAGEWEDTTYAQYAVDAVCRMVRSGPWKYNYYHGMAPELFHMEADPAENNNLAGQSAYADIEQGLKKLVLRNWDPEWVQARKEQIVAGRPLIANWVRTTNPPEPDVPWFNSAPENWVDNSQASRSGSAPKEDSATTK